VQLQQEKDFERAAEKVIYKTPVEQEEGAGMARVE
jgi:hypothetical protein